VNAGPVFLLKKEKKNMKKYAIAGICIILMLALTGCGQNPAALPAESQSDDNKVREMTSSPAQENAIASETSSAESPEASVGFNALEAEDYHIDGTELTVDMGNAQKLIYNASDQFPTGWTCSLGNLIVEDDALYLTEGGSPEDENADSSAYRIISLDRDGSDRINLYEQEDVGFIQMVSYGDKIVFVSDGFDSVKIGWVDKDRSAQDWVDFSDYAVKQGFEAEYNHAEIYFVGDDLFADMTFFDLDREDGELTDGTVWIKPDMTVQSAVD